MMQQLGSLIGIWRCRNGQFANVSKETGHNFTGHILSDEPPGLPRMWGPDGNCIGAGREYDLIDRKRGNEKGWPTLKEL